MKIRKISKALQEEPEGIEMPSSRTAPLGVDAGGGEGHHEDKERKEKSQSSVHGCAGSVVEVNC